MSDIETVGIIGGGEFGQSAAKTLVPRGADILMHDKNPHVPPPEGVRSVGLNALIGADVIILATPYNAYEQLLPILEEEASAETLIVDVCSVKLRPTRLYRDHGLLDRENILMTHPLFGPQSLAEPGTSKNLVVTHQRGDIAQKLIDDWTQKGIETTSMSPIKHDLEMAKVHALTFFIGRGLLKMGIEPSPLNTPYFSKLLALIDVERQHSDELFDTIQRHNPFAFAMRQKLLDTLQDLHEQTSEKYSANE